MVAKILSMQVLIIAAVIAVGTVSTVAWRFAPFWMPFSWTREPGRLAAVLGIRPGSSVADIGAGDGRFGIAVAALTGSAGQVFATELDPDRRAAIVRHVRRANASNVHLVVADSGRTGLPAECCDAIYMRTVLHHIKDRPAFAVEVAKALRPGGRIGVIDFAPGDLWFHGRDHGVRASDVIASFEAAGLRVRHTDDRWGGGMFLIVFEKAPSVSQAAGVGGRGADHCFEA